jgi:hypothetical protein
VIVAPYGIAACSTPKGVRYEGRKECVSRGSCVKVIRYAVALVLIAARIGLPTTALGEARSA